MLILYSTSTLQIVTDAAITVDVHASHLDVVIATGVVTPNAPTNTAITTATTTTVVAAPAAGTARNVNNLTARNKHATTSVNVTVRHADATTVELYKVSLPSGFTLNYEDGAGWFIGPTVPAVIAETLVSSGTTTTVSGPLAADQLIVWNSATGGTKTATIPTSAGTRRRITMVDAQGTATSAAPNIAAPVSGSVIGTPLTDRIIDANGSLTLVDSSIGWVLGI